MSATKDRLMRKIELLSEGDSPTATGGARWATPGSALTPIWSSAWWRIQPTRQFSGWLKVRCEARPRGQEITMKCPTHL